MKKGYIAGKGYVLRSGTYVCVVGGVNIDIGGQPNGKLIRKDSNPGRVRTSLGGVGRNIAHNLCLLGADVMFLTAFGDDSYAQKIEASCANLGIDISHALKVKDGSTSTYLFLLDENGDMELAVSDMEICNAITPEYLKKNITILNNSQIVMMDTNISEDSIRFLCENCTAPIFADPVSVHKAGKLKSWLGKIHTLKPNCLEAELLSGVKITDEKSLHIAAQKLLDTGMHRVFISLGEDGVLAADHNEMLHLPIIKADMKNATGAGDAFMAALARAYLEGTDLYNAGMFASAAASIAVEGQETINSKMSMDLVKTKIRENKKEKGE